MFGKINLDHIKHNLNKAKIFIGHHYVQGKNMLHNIDAGVRVAKKVYGAVAPALQSLSGNENFNKFNKHAMNAVKNYDTIRQNVLESHNEGEKHVNQTMSNLKKAGVNLGLD